MCNKRIEPTYLHRIEQKEKEEERHVSWMEQEVGGGFLVFFPHTLSAAFISWVQQHLSSSSSSGGDGSST